MANFGQFSCIFLITSMIYIQAAPSAPEFPAPIRARVSMPDITNAARSMPKTNADVSSRQYDSLFARNKMFPCAAVAYQNSATISRCLTTALGGGARLQRKLEFWLPGQYGLLNATVSGFTAVSPADRAIIISFRGTAGLTPNDTLHQIIQALEEVNQAPNWFNFYNVGYVERYFNDAFAFLWNLGMSHDFDTLKNQYPGYDLWITGHSLGGATASIAAAFIVLTELYPGNKIKLVTFGQPRSGNKEFAAYLDSKISEIFRIVHASDLVPHVPPQAINYHHHATEIWYNNDMYPGTGYHICRGDLPDCSNSLALPISINDHGIYFNHTIAVFGANGCTGTALIRDQMIQMEPSQ